MRFSGCVNVYACTPLEATFGAGATSPYSAEYLYVLMLNDGAPACMFVSVHG